MSEISIQYLESCDELINHLITLRSILKDLRIRNRKARTKTD